MSDSFIVIMDDGSIEHFNRAACFAPLGSFKSHLIYKYGDKCKKKPVNIIYTITHNDFVLLKKYCKMVASIPHFQNIIEDLSFENARREINNNNFGVAIITVSCNVPTDAMLYCLGAFRNIQERNYDHHISALLATNLKEISPAICYLLCEQIHSNLCIEICERHSNVNPNISEKEVHNFHKGTGKFGIQRKYSDYMKKDRNWGHCAGPKGGKVGEKFLDNLVTNVKVMRGKDPNLTLYAALEQCVVEFIEKKSKPKVAKKPKADTSKREIRAKQGKAKVKVGINLWRKQLNVYSNSKKGINCRRVYNAGYRKGYRLNNQRGR